MFLLSVIFGLALVYLLPWPQTAQEGAIAAGQTAPATAGVASTSRRDFMKYLGGGALALLGGAALWAVIRQALQPPPNAQLEPVDAGGTATGSPTVPPHATAVAGTTPAPAPAATPEATAVANNDFANVKALLVPEITPTDSFYITTKNFIDPTVSGDSWTLSFMGLVDNPYTVNMKDIQALPPVTRPQTLACISNPVGGSLIGNANWKGVDFAAMLQKAKPKSNAIKVIVRAADGYEDSFPLDVALNNQVVLAYEMNGQPLVTKHGYPTRLLVPNIYGMKNCKWLTQVELTDQDFMGYWEGQGWDDVAHYQIQSRIDYPNTDQIDAKPLYVGGIAFAGNRGIKRVEVTTDGGNTWADAQLRPAMGPFTWVQWTYPWEPKPGVYTLQVRATDGTGAVQTSQQQDTYPSGATGYHTVQVRVG
jgi:DMSO/TMAO reductase YedYZ molybdopterin-dependent catalytic subunit